MQRITIEMDDDGLITVMVEGDGVEPETLTAESADDALEMARERLMGEEAEEADEPAGMDQEEGEMDAAAMWDEEASKRPKNPNLMR